MNIAVIGAGNIGTRHLQAITKCEEDHKVFAVEPTTEAQSKSREMLGAAGQGVGYVSKVEDLPAVIDIAILAVNSGIRRRIAEQLLAHSSVQYMILEKVLFPYVKDYAEVEKLLQKHKVKAWVNCARRSWSYTRTLKGYFERSTAVSMRVQGNMWGLGCNTIHYIDLLSHLTNCQGPIQVDISALDEEIIPSKREGYVEFTGELNIQLGPHRLKLVSSRGENNGFVIDIQSKRLSCHITEKGSEGVNLITDNSTGLKRTELFEVPFQSSLTTQVVQDLLRTGTCPLTTYRDSVKLHIPMLQAFAKKINNEQEYCNIT